MIKNLNLDEIKKYLSSNSNLVFLKHVSVINQSLKLEARLLKGDFFLDSFNYFPITKENYSFGDFFSWGDSNKYKNFYTKNFFNIFDKKKNSFKKYENVYVLGSSSFGNYYRDMVTFFPRLLLLRDKKVNLAIHRNSTIKYRNFIIDALTPLNITISKFIYLDDDFYEFHNSKIPQFLPKEVSIDILNQLALRKEKKNSQLNKIYISRQDSKSRNIINEKDLIDTLKENGFKIVKPSTLMIKKQINLFASAKVVVGATSSSLTNIAFCRKGTKIIEIGPKYSHKYENGLKNRYSEIANQLGLNYSFLQADPIDIKQNNVYKNLEKYISAKVLRESNYYKDLLVKKNEFQKLLAKAN